MFSPEREGQGVANIRQTIRYRKILQGREPSEKYDNRSSRGTCQTFLENLVFQLVQKNRVFGERYVETSSCEECEEPHTHMRYTTKAHNKGINKGAQQRYTKKVHI